MILFLLSAISLANARPQATDIGNSGSTNTLSGELLKLSRHDQIFNDAMQEENLDHQPAFWEGDIMMTDKQKEFYTKMSSELTFKKALISDVSKLWLPHKTVPYIYADEIDAEGKQIVEKAMKHWRKHTCLDFKPRTTEEDYVEFVFFGGCASYVGRIGGKQIISIGSISNKCKVGNLIHELGHCIGFYHEQSRPDRDSYVEVVKANIRPGFEQNFMKMAARMIDSKNVPYDYGSIMHYPDNFFSKSKHDVTLKILGDPHGAEVGQRRALSDKDILQAKLLYNCQ